MSAIEKLAASASNFGDPSLQLQRPTSAKTPDVSHILADVFGDLFTKDALSVNTIRNLDISSDVDDEYHKRYVKILRDAQMIKENRLQMYAKLEKHIMEARAKALAFEERDEARRHQVCDEPDAYGIPPTKAYFTYCLDELYLKDHGLLVPSDYKAKPKAPFVPIPRNNKEQSFLRETKSSVNRLNKSSVLPPISSARTPNLDEIDIINKPDSDDGSILSYRSYDDGNSDDENRGKRKQPFWKDAPLQEERVNDKEKLKQLQSRINYLPNPRLEAARFAQSKEQNPNPELIFEINPKVLIFDKYVIGKVYESSFEVRNISTVAHQFRALPAKTQFFCLSLGMYPQGQSIIAPGLSATFNVRFAPDCLATFEDEIVVECSNGSKIVLPIVAKRESPCLTIGSVVNCGHALVGQIKVCRFVVQNEGGDGRFVVFPKNAWPAATFKTNVSSTPLNMYPFEVQPSIFELHRGSVFVLEVIFKPPDVNKYEQDIVIACDNCTTLEFKLMGEGHLAEVEYIEIGDEVEQAAQNQVAIDEFKDKLSNRIIRFPTLNPNVFTRKRFQIKNKTACPIDYSWIIYKPILEDNLTSENSVKNLDYVVEKDTFFTIGPKSGTFDRNETKTFEVLFSPNKVGSFSSVSQLVLHSIPEINKQLMLDTTSELHKTLLVKEDLATTDFVAHVVELRGDCDPFQFALDPPALYVPGQNYMRSTVRKAFRLINMSICPITFSWKQIHEPYIIQVEPAYGEIAPKSFVLMDVLVTGVKPGKIVEDIACYVENAEEPVRLHVEADIKGPELVIKEAAVDFGLVQMGNKIKSFVTIENISNLPLKWHLICAEFQDSFKFRQEGELKPLETDKIEIEFIPLEEMVINTQFEVLVEDGNSISFNCMGQSQRPSASLLNSSLLLEELYLNVEKKVVVQLSNHSMLEAEFVWGEPEGEDARFCLIDIEPKHSRIASKSMFECLLRIKANELVDLNDLRIPCYIQETTAPVFLNLTGIVKGVTVDYFVSDPDSSQEPTRLFNNIDAIKFIDIKAGEKIVKHFSIKNLSGISTRASFKIKLFRVHEETVLSSESSSKFIDPMKKIGNFFDRLRLDDNFQGIGFGMERYTVDLPPFGTTVCPIILLAEMWGSYTDALLIDIDGVDDQQCIQLNAEVIDLPIKLYTGKVSESETEEVAMLRFGSQTQGQEPITRKLQLLSTSYIPLQVDWKIFIVSKNDQKLVDVNILNNEQSGQSIMRSRAEGKASANSSSKRESALSLQKENTSDDLSSNGSVIESKINPVKEDALGESNDSFDFFDYFVDERVPLIKLKISQHYGQEVTEDNKVFYFGDTRMTLRPRDKTTVSVTFNTLVKKCLDYEAVFVGYLTLPEKYLEGEGFSRKMGFDKEPIRFKATGTVVAPSLTVEYENEDLSYIMATGDLIDTANKTVRKEMFFKNQFSLLNISLAPMDFVLKTNAPFCFADFSHSSKRLSLKPKAKQKVEVLFKLDNEFIQAADFAQSNPIVLEDVVVVEFTEDMRQPVPLKAKIYGPTLKLTATRVDFGHALIDQERCMQIVIRNPSYSSVLWSLSKEDDVHSVFRTDVSSGLLEGNKTFINRNEQIINIFFKARFAEHYSARLFINTNPRMSGDAMVVDLTGYGGYDQKLEAILNV